MTKLPQLFLPLTHAIQRTTLTALLLLLMVMSPDERFGNRLRSLLPLSRHATFGVRLVIHEVTNIPLINGQFAVRWKFKNVVSGRSDLSRASTPLSVTTFKTNGSVEPTGTPTSEFGSQETPRLTAEEKGKGKVVDVNQGGGGDDEDDDGPTPLQTAATNGSTTYGQFLTPTPVSQTHPSTKPAPTPSLRSSSGQQTPTLADARSDGKGWTSYVQLRDHAVRWEHTTEVVVELKIKRETNDLLPSELKLVVQELALQGVDNQMQSRFGVLYLNLAEYADAGPVTRRYLLRESKTNATLKLTIDSVWLHGDKEYKVPPLQKGQAVSGVAGVLSKSYMDISSPRFLSPNLVPGGASSRASTPRNGVFPTSKHGHGSFRRESVSSLSSAQRMLADPGLHTAEWVIENIFNPWPSSSKTPSPFTIYSPTAPPSRPPSVRSLDATLSTESDLHGTVDTHGTFESKMDCGTTEAAADAGPAPQDTTTTATVKIAAPPSRPPTPPGGLAGWWRRLGGGGAVTSTKSSPTSSRPSTPPTTQPTQYRKRKSSGENSIAASSRHSLSNGLRRSNSQKSGKWSTANGVLPIVSVDDYGGP